MPANSNFHLHISYRGWVDSLLKKSLSVQGGFLHIRTKIPINRKGVTALTVFLLSFFVETSHKAFLGVGCCSPPANLDFQKNSDWR